MARLQQALKDKKFYRGSIDGIYGAQTQQAVMAFRKEIGASRSFSWSDSHWDELEIYQAPYTRFARARSGGGQPEQTDRPPVPRWEPGGHLPDLLGQR